MSIKINNMNLLNENDYDKMIIRGNNDKYSVNLKKTKEPFPKIKSKYKWTDNLNELDDESKISKIINYYLEYTTINKIADDVVLPYYNEVFTEVSGDRKLYLSIKSSLSNDIKTNIKMKYYNDREQVIQQNKDINYYRISATNYSSYKIINNDSSIMEINLLSYQNGIGGNRYLNEVENEFLKDFILEKLNEEGMEAIIENQNLYNEDDEDYINFGYFVTCGNLTIDVNSVDLLPNVVNIVNKYNKERESTKKLQLKLEGF